jgi:hypothetical protein
MRSLGRPAFFLCLATGSLPVFDAALAQTRTPAAAGRDIGWSTVTTIGDCSPASKSGGVLQ